MSIDQIINYEPKGSKKRKYINETDEPPTKKTRLFSNEVKQFMQKRISKDEKKKLEDIISKPESKKDTFKSLGICNELVKATKALDWTKPTPIQIESIPHALLQKDIIALAETGSGKSASFIIPLLQSLLDKPIPYHSLILSPTRELSLNLNDEAIKLGKDIGLISKVIIGGVDRTLQAISLQKKPHLIIGSPGRILDHLTNKVFKIHNLKFFIMDEADRLLNSEFELAIEGIVKAIKEQKKYFLAQYYAKNNIPIKKRNMEWHNYQTLLFSATMTKKVEKIEKACLKEPIIKIEVNNKYKTVKTLSQFYLFIPAKHKLCYMVYLINSILNDTSIIIFCNTIKSCHHLSLVLHNLKFNIIPLHGEMNQYERLGAISKFKSGQKQILIATDVASRGLDIPLVKTVVNYDLPIYSKDYIHRVGRTARQGKKGEAINLITQYDVEIFQRIEELIGITMEKYPNISEDEVLLLIERVMKADNIALMQMKEYRDETKKRIKQLTKVDKSMIKIKPVKFNNDSKQNNNNDDDDDDDIDNNNNGRMIGSKRRSLEERWNHRLKVEAKRNNRNKWSKRNGRGRGRGRGRGGRGRGRGRSNNSMRNYSKSFQY